MRKPSPLRSLLILLYLPTMLSVQFSELPPSGTIPERMISTSSVLLSKSNKILTYGGIKASSSQISSTLYQYSIPSNRFDEIIPNSELSPPNLFNSKLFIQSSRYLILLFGSNKNFISSTIYKFDLDLLVWSTILLSGFTLPGLEDAASCLFFHNQIEYFAIFGGLSIEGLQSALYLIETESLVVKKMENNGKGPKGQIGASMAYYSGAVYIYGINQDLNVNCLYRFGLDDEIWQEVWTSDKSELIVYHTSYVFDDKLFVFFGTDKYSARAFSFIQIYSFTSRFWTSTNQSSDYRALHSSVQDRHHVYFLFGQTRQSSENSLIRFDLNTLSARTLTSSADFPSKRKNHISFVFDNEFYIFSGLSETSEYLNDLWKFSFKSLSWSKLEPSGAVPSCRASMNSVLVDSVGIILTGGKTDSQIFNEMFYLEIKNIYFVQLDFLTPWKSPRFSSCLISFEQYYFEIGGRDFSSLAADVFVFDYLKTRTKVFTLPKYLRLVNHNCMIGDAGDDDLKIFVLGGTSIDGITNNEVFELRVTGLKLGEVGIGFGRNSSLESLSYGETAFYDFDGKVYLVGGTLWNKYLSSRFVFYELERNRFEFVNMPDYLLLSGHSVNHYRNSLLVFGGARGFSGIKTFETFSNSLYQITFEPGDKISLACSKGTFGADCTPCPLGTTFIANSCKPCPKGTYSNVIGADGIMECIPCEYGFYTDKEGSSYCRNCPAGYKCPIGSSKPCIKTVKYKENSTQPHNYHNNSTKVSYLNTNFWYIFAIVSLAITIFIAIYQPSRNFLYFIDFFKKSHNQPIGRPVIYEKTKLGGLFFIYFMVLAVLTIIISIFVYTEKNINENKSLVPVITIDAEVKSEVIEVGVVLMNYGGTCVDANKCYYAINVNTIGFGYDKKEMSCFLSGFDCWVRVIYYNVEIYKESDINIKLDDLRAFASGILVKISSSSSIPNETSESFVPIYPESDELLFRGKIPTVINYEFIPSLFYSESEKWDQFSSGYHIRYTSDYTIGDQVNQKKYFPIRFYLNTYLNIKLHISLSSTALITKRTIKNNWITFFGSLSGTIFGIMEAVMSLMVLCEIGIERMKYKNFKNNEKFKLLKKRSKLFETFKKVFGNRKILWRKKNLRTCRPAPVETTS